MIYLDKRTGSGDLSSYFERWKLPYQSCILEFADVAFCGNGPGGPVDVGIELKTIYEILDYIHGDTGFSGHQLPGLLRSYYMTWLVIEGWAGFNYEGLLTQKKGDQIVPVERNDRYVMYADFAHWMMTMEAKAQLRIKRTTSRLETARFVSDLYSWWTAKEWNQHRSCLVFHDPGPPDGEIPLRPLHLKHRWAKELAGVGWKRSKAVCRQFKSARQMANAPAEAWLEIDGIGEILAKRIVAAIEEEE